MSGRCLVYYLSDLVLLSRTWADKLESVAKAKIGGKWTGREDGAVDAEAGKLFNHLADVFFQDIESRYGIFVQDAMTLNSHAS